MLIEQKPIRHGARFAFLVLLILFMAGFRQGVQADDRRILNRFAGLYEGRWVRPSVFRTATGSVIRASRTLPIKLRLPPRRGRTVGRIDMDPIRNDRPRFVDLVCRFTALRIRSQGRFVRYRARAAWLLGTAGLDESDFRGRLNLRATRMGSREKVEGRLIVRGDGAGWDGVIRASRLLNQK